ncbi:hypothetical protein A2Z22_01210 [Candidatus Woesebacteria bacterium RBG_16_34_12]|uniref:Bacterial bifunctional deaminase-reductase C-terminal domain-containing protein n=1 Tax=Candidatus Woesebacteria bacterium RBG_16_34_12 TaxID=1802480 RepID=A0A1F7X8M4_9BACT|nr:MAG: hypothetical protein A2Z22_01210 [Candidatus Woesebacteria bacterium RBG_16_34_12]
MKITLYMAISVDGYIAKKDGDSDWISEDDNENFEEEIGKRGCIIVGRKTFDQFKGDLYPIEGVTNIILTTNQKEKKEDRNVFFACSPQEAVEIAKKQGHKEVLLIGGGTTNRLFLKENLIDEVILSVHPLILGDGIKLFDGGSFDVGLELIGVNKLEEDLVQLRYKVKK